MNVRIAEMPERSIVGVAATASTVSDLDISRLWQDFERESGQVKHSIPGRGYEIHIDDAASERHICLAGVEMERVEDLPLQMFVKVIPAGTYAVFTHQLKDGGFPGAYQVMGEWLRHNGYAEALPLEIQCYDARFNGITDPASELDFHIPIKETK